MHMYITQPQTTVWLRAGEGAGTRLRRPMEEENKMDSYKREGRIKWIFSTTKVNF